MHPPEPPRAGIDRPEMEDSPQEDSPPDHPEADAPEADNLDNADGAPADLRLDRIEEYVADALQMPDALQASVNAASGDLLRMQYRLQQALNESLAPMSTSPQAIADLIPAVNTCLKVGQQAERFLQLSLKLKSVKAGS